MLHAHPPLSNFPDTGADEADAVVFAPARLMLPEAPASEAGVVKVWSQPVEMLTYEPARPEPHPVFLEKRVYQGSSGKVYPLPVIDRVETTPVSRMWQAIHIENEWIRVMVLPEIGGRIHVAFDKRTGYDFIYRQNVIKPALVGLAGPWVSGGIEFNWPQHHRPATYMAVETAIERHADGSATIWCSDHDPMERMKGMHGICLQPGRAVMEVKVRLYNRTLDTRSFLWWANVATHAHEQYQSFFPHDVHFAADHAKRAMTSYPLSTGQYYGIDYGARVDHGVPENERPPHFIPDGSYPPNDLGWYANIPVPTSYMIANSAGDFSGGYDHKRQAGTVAIADHHTQPGKKQWTWGNHDFGYAWDRSLTDNDGPYVELMVGAYTDNQPDFSFLAPGETKSFSQYWYPIAEIGVPDLATLEGAIRVEGSQDGLRVHLQTTADHSAASVRVSQRGETAGLWEGPLSAETPLHHEFHPGALDRDYVVTVESAGHTLLRYAPGEIVPAEPPAVAEEPPAPADVAGSDELYLTGLHLEQYRHPTRSPELYWLEALRRDAGDSRCNHAMGRLYLRRGEFAQAESYLRAAVERMRRRNPNPYDGEPLYNLGLTLLYLDRESEAYDAFYKSTWNAAWVSAGYHRLAEIDCRRGDWTLALDHLRRSLARDTENLGALNLRALVLRKLQRDAEATQELEAIASLDVLDVVHRYLRDGAVPQDGQQSLDLCFDLLRAGFVQEAESLVAAAIPQVRAADAPDGSATMLLYLQAHIARLLGQDAAGAALDAAAADPMYVFPHRLEEMLLLQEAVRANPADAHANLFLGNLLYDKRRHEEAMTHWRQAVELDGSLTTAWRNLAVGEFNVHHNAEAALAAFSRARMCDPQDVRLLYEFDQLLKRLGRSPRERLRRLEEQWELVSLRDDLSVEAASLLSSTGRPQEALNLLLSRQFQPWEGGEGATLVQYMRAHLLLAVDCLEVGDEAFAREHLLRAFDPPPSLAEGRHVLMNTSKYHYWLGVAMEQAEAAGADAEWERAAAERRDFEQMEVKGVSEATYWSAAALRRLGREVEAEERFGKILDYAEDLERKPATIDFFATSLPTMLLFEEDLAAGQKTTAMFLKAQAKIGLAHDEGKSLLQSVLERDPSHTGALDMLRLMGR